MRSLLAKKAQVTAPMRSVGGKLAGATTALILVVTVGVYLKLSRYQRENLLQSKEVSASAVTRLFADSCIAPVVFDDDQAIKDALTTLGRNEEVEYAAVWSVNQGGKVSRRLGELQRGRSEIGTDVPQAIRIRRQPDRVLLESPVRDQAGNAIAVAVVAFSLARENRAIKDVERTTLIVSSVLGLGFMVLLMAMARLVVVGPLRKLVRASKELEEGGSGEVDVQTSDEVGQLARAFRSMAAAIKVREEHIKTRNRDMRLVLDNVGQGFITLDHEGTISSEHSRVIDEWFGSPGSSLKFWDYLRPIDVATAEWFEIGWIAIREDVMPLSLCLDQLPKLAHKNDRTFELVYRPIMEGVRLNRTIVVITDVTARIERERAEQAQREMMNIFRHFLSDRTALDEFFAEANLLIWAITKSGGADMSLLKRQVHTLKGNAALFGIESVANFCHDIEDGMEELPEPISPATREALLVLWARVRDMHAQLGRSSAEGGVELDRGEYAAFLTDLQDPQAHDLLVATATSWRFEPASKRLAHFGQQIRDLAKRLGKGTVEVICQPTTLRLPPRKWTRFWSAFAHVVRNTADHAVETVEDRIVLGKNPHTTVVLGIAREGNHLVVSVHDDGPGIAWQTIAARARERGLPHTTRADLEAALFVEGISSRAKVTGNSGRGVGLCAVRDVVRDLGGHIEVRTDEGHGTMFRFVLPESMLFDDAWSNPSDQNQGDGPGPRAVTN